MRLSRKLFPLVLVLATACTPASPTIHDAWLRAAPDGSVLGVAYLDVENPGEDDWITGVSSDAHESASLHETLLEDGVSRMRMHARVPLPAGETVSFRPGGLHIMLGAPRRVLAPGDSVKLALTLEKGGVIHADAVVSRQRP